MVGGWGGGRLGKMTESGDQDGQAHLWARSLFQAPGLRFPGSFRNSFFNSTAVAQILTSPRPLQRRGTRGLGAQARRVPPAPAESTLCALGALPLQRPGPGGAKAPFRGDSAAHSRGLSPARRLVQRWDEAPRRRLRRQTQRWRAEGGPGDQLPASRPRVPHRLPAQQTASVVSCGAIPTAGI